MKQADDDLLRAIGLFSVARFCFELQFGISIEYQGMKIP